MDKVRKEARKPICGSVLPEEVSTVSVSELSTRDLPPEKLKLFVLNAGR